MLPDSTINQIVQTMRLQATSRDSGEAHIRLDPAQFGGLSVSLHVEQGQVAARLEADSPAVREWLQANQSLLRHQLAEQNLTLDRFEVAEPDEPRSPADRRQGRDGQPADHGRRPPRAPESESAARFEVVA
jgi:flagellar hook-length control protein FliK